MENGESHPRDLRFFRVVVGMATISFHSFVNLLDRRAGRSAFRSIRRIQCNVSRPSRSARLALSHRMRRFSTITHRRIRVNVSGLVIPSPVGDAML